MHLELAFSNSLLSCIFLLVLMQQGAQIQAILAFFIWGNVFIYVGSNPFLLGRLLSRWRRTLQVQVSRWNSLCSSTIFESCYSFETTTNSGLGRIFLLLEFIRFVEETSCISGKPQLPRKCRYLEQAFVIEGENLEEFHMCFCKYESKGFDNVIAPVSQV